MKHFMLPKNAILREAHSNDSPSPSSYSSSPNPNSSKSKPPRRHKSAKENAPPSDLNSLSLPDQKASSAPNKMKSPLPPRPPNSLKRKLVMDTAPENAVTGVYDSGVKVIVRMRPVSKDEEDGERIVQNVSSDSLTINGHTFTFDSIADFGATQLDVFQLVGVPLVENCLAGFNSSVFAYGQTGSGKTYTMWGPANALLEENLKSDQQGLTPRVLERLFSRINEEQIKHADEQLNYQCRCSFLEIYNEQITDLLDPSQRNLQIREDVKTGVYVENLTEENVSNMKDVTQLLIKGLSNRRTGATCINAESSRSHSVFTCVVESRCKSKADGLSRFKTSRINLVDLAGSERQKLTGAGGERLKEAGNINRSLSQLGNLINILAEVSQTGKQRHIPYRDSRLTFLLQDSLGGNAKLAMICAISPAPSCKSETFSTLRFAQRAKAIKNKAVVNEVMQDDVNYLREVIRQLRDELHRMKSNGNQQTDSNGNFSAGWARRSLNLLKRSFHHPMTLPRIDDDGDEEMEIDEDAVEKLCDHVDLHLSNRENSNSIKEETVQTGKSLSELRPNTSEGGAVQEKQGLEDTDVNMEEEISEHIDELMIFDCTQPVKKTSEISGDIVSNQNALDQNGEENLKRSTVEAHNENSYEHPSEEKITCILPGSDLPAAKSIDKPIDTGSSCPKCDPVSRICMDVSVADIFDCTQPVKKTSEISGDIVSNQNALDQNGEENLKRSTVEAHNENSYEHPSEEKITCILPGSDLPAAKSIDKPIDTGSSCPKCDPVSRICMDVSVADIVPSGPANNCVNCMSSSSLSIVPSDVSPILKSPTPSVSPRLSNGRKSLRTSSMLTASQGDLRDDNKLGSEDVHTSFSKSGKSSCNALPTGAGKNIPLTTERLAASLHRGLEVLDNHRQSTALRRSTFRFSYRPPDFKPFLPAEKVDVGVQTSQNDEILKEDPALFICSNCKNRNQVENEELIDRSDLQLVPVEGTETADKSKKQVPKAVEKVLAGAIRREMVLEEFSAKQASEIKQLNRLLQQYRHERECNAVISQTREDKILRLESLMDGVLTTEEFMEEELASLMHEHKLLKEKYENHPEVLRTNIELERAQDLLEQYRNFCDLGEREVLLEEIQDLRSQLQYYIDTSVSSTRKRNPLPQLTYSCEPSLAPPLKRILESTEESAEERFERERSQWTEVESKWISLTEELRIELEASRSLADQQKVELDAEKRCAEEWKEAMQLAMKGHARLLEQYADLEEKHMQLLARHRKIQEGICDVKKAAAKAGVRGAESKFINALAAEISALKAEREKERRYLKDENKGLQAQLRDTAEAVQAAGELLVRLKEAEEAVAASEKRAIEAELETEKAYKQIDQLKKNHENEIQILKEMLAESRLPREAIQPAFDDHSSMTKYDEVEAHSVGDQRWREEFEQFKEEDSVLQPSSWFSGYDRCNI